MAGCPSSYQQTRIREKTLESGNLFSGSWISASIPQLYYCWIVCDLVNCSNSRVAGLREMIREAGSDFREVILCQKNFMWKNGNNIYYLSANEIYKYRLKVWNKHQTTYKIAVNHLSHSYDWKLVSDNMWYVWSNLISEWGIKRDGNSREVYTGIRERKRELLQHSNVIALVWCSRALVSLLHQVPKSKFFFSSRIPRQVFSSFNEQKKIIH